MAVVGQPVNDMPANLADAGLLEMRLDLPPKRPSPGLAVDRGEGFQLEVGEADWLRGRAWALAIALGCFTYYWEKMPGRRRDRLAMAQSVLADAIE